jgi:hypothetical protein
VEKNKGIEKESKVIMKNHGSSSEDESESWLRHRKDKQNVEEKQSGGASIEEGEKDHSGAPMRLQKIDDSWLSWMVSNLASGAKNVYSYFANWFYGDSYELENEEIEKKRQFAEELDRVKVYKSVPDYIELLKASQVVSNKILEIKISSRETNEYRGDKKGNYISKLLDILNEPMPTAPKEKQDYLLKIISVTLELEAVYGDAGKAAEEYTNKLDKQQESKLYDVVLYKTKIKEYMEFEYNAKFNQYLKNKGIDKKDLDESSINKLKIECKKEEEEKNQKLYDKGYSKNYTGTSKQKMEDLCRLWEFDESEGVEKFKGNLEELYEWRKITEDFSYLLEPTELLGANFEDS